MLANSLRMLGITTLDRYIIGKYLSTFFFMVLIFSLISISIDISDKLDNFLAEKISWRSVVFDYYINFIPNINTVLFPLYALISVIFFTSRMAFNSEIIVIFGNGISYRALLKPYMIAALVLISIELAANHFIVPIGNKKRVRFENAYFYKGNIKNKMDDIHLFTNPQTKIYIKHYSLADSTAIDFSIEGFNPEHELIYRINAPRAEWQPTIQAWRLLQWRARAVNGMDERFTQGATKDTAIANFTPRDIERRDNIMQAMTTPELYRFIQSERMRGAGGYGLYEVELHRRTAEPFTVIILTLIGLALAGRKVRGGMGFHLAAGAIIGGLYIFVTKFSATLSINTDLPAIIGVWVPNIIFGVVAFFLVRGAQK